MVDPQENLPSHQHDDLCEDNFVDLNKVRGAKSLELPASEVEDLSVIFKALSDPGRLRLVRALMAGPLCVCDLAALTGSSQSAVSHQLRHLKHLKLVGYERQGRRVYYHVADDHVSRLMDLCLEHIRE